MFGKIFLFFRKSQYLVLIKLMQSNRVVTAWLLLHTDSAFYSVFVVWAVFQLRWRKKTYLKRRPLFRSQIFKFCCDIQGSHLIGYLWVSLIIDQSECLICFFLCTELTLFCTELTLFCTELTLFCTELTLLCTDLVMLLTKIRCAKLDGIRQRPKNYFKTNRLNCVYGQRLKQSVLLWIL